MNIRWTPQAAGDLEHISQRIAEDNQEAALKTARTIFDVLSSLSHSRIVVAWGAKKALANSSFHPFLTLWFTA